MNIENPIDEFFNSGLEAYEAKYLTVDHETGDLPVSIVAIVDRTGNTWNGLNVELRTLEVSIYVRDQDVPTPKKGDKIYVKETATSSQETWTVKDKTIDGTGITVLWVTQK